MSVVKPKRCRFFASVSCLEILPTRWALGPETKHKTTANHRETKRKTIITLKPKRNETSAKLQSLQKLLFLLSLYNLY
jgi:hypothetical protein